MYEEKMKMIHEMKKLKDELSKILGEKGELVEQLESSRDSAKFIVTLKERLE